MIRVWISVSNTDDFEMLGHFIWIKKENEFASSTIKVLTAAMTWARSLKTSTRHVYMRVNAAPHLFKMHVYTKSLSNSWVQCQKYRATAKNFQSIDKNLSIIYYSRHFVKNPLTFVNNFQIFFQSVFAMFSGNAR